MKIKAITNLREFIFNTNHIKTTNRGCKGFSILKLAKTKLSKGENLLKLEEI